MNSGRSQRGRALQIAEQVIALACWFLPETERADRALEWTVVAEEIATDPQIRWSLWRALCTLRFAVSLLLHVRATRRTQQTIWKRLGGLATGQILDAVGNVFWVGGFLAFMVGYVATGGNGGPPGDTGTGVVLIVAIVYGGLLAAVAAVAGVLLLLRMTTRGGEE